MADLGQAERRFVERSIRRRRIFGALSVLGVAAGLGLGLYYGLGGPADSGVLQVLVVILVLLNARSNLRQYRYASVLKKLTTETRR